MNAAESDPFLCKSSLRTSSETAASDCSSSDRVNLSSSSAITCLLNLKGSAKRKPGSSNSSAPTKSSNPTSTKCPVPLVYSSNVTTPLSSTSIVAPMLIQPPGMKISVVNYAIVSLKVIEI